ncbi:MAG: prepilin-type N-terminal cleavage/methylation domain-containing protein [Gammaproteobacteria bacterium]|nr:prepilin-type N-terminal cleavage/methylation domain-containing protein [Gammaproteobacteria bacterium]MDH4253166.1 prepilin-type N-terminal cleavage/methylation domain-containing protein [Gammaproteobacteria bacterium]MDH5308472.1 prepilin-type N-terminal cleavage/methylation domain-containing protein [Gammaproteobacteria bacterium]
MVSTRKRAQRQTGFTLIELLVALTIAALLVVLARPMYTAAVPGARLRAEVHDLAISLRDARNRAVNGSRITSVRLDTEVPDFAVESDPATVFSSGTTLRASQLAIAGERAQPADDERQFVVHFYPDGSSSGAAIELANRAGAYRIDVDWLNGRVTAGVAGDDAP